MLHSTSMSFKVQFCDIELGLKIRLAGVVI